MVNKEFQTNKQKSVANRREEEKDTRIQQLRPPSEPFGSFGGQLFISMTRI